MSDLLASLSHFIIIPCPAMDWALLTLTVGYTFPALGEIKFVLILADDTTELNWIAKDTSMLMASP